MQLSHPHGRTPPAADQSAASEVEGCVTCDPDVTGYRRTWTITQAGLTSLWRDRASIETDTDTDLQDSYDDIVVGAGITGLVTALLLARSGRHVAAIEAREVGAVTTGNTTGKVSLLQGTRLTPHPRAPEPAGRPRLPRGQPRGSGVVAALLRRPRRRLPASHRGDVRPGPGRSRVGPAGARGRHAPGPGRHLGRRPRCAVPARRRNDARRPGPARRDGPPRGSRPRGATGGGNRGDGTPRPGCTDRLDGRDPGRRPADRGRERRARHGSPDPRPWPVLRRRWSRSARTRWPSATRRHPR